MGVADDVRALIDKYSLSKILNRLDRLERYVSQVDDVLTALNSATNDVAEDLERLRGEVAGLDAATAEKFAPLVERLRELAVDPENPVPAQ
jgi:Asp-tRNA(Asn)/Glu-tRNA(Gln) amidotransferase C subunit